MKTNLKSTFSVSVISETDVTKNLPGYCVVPVMNSKARELILPQGTILTQYFSCHLFFIEFFEVNLRSSLSVSTTASEALGTVFFMFEGCINISAQDRSMSAEVKEKSFLMAFRDSDVITVCQLQSGRCRFCRITFQKEWFEYTVSSYSALYRLQATLRKKSNYVVLPQSHIDLKIEKAINSLTKLDQKDPFDIEMATLVQIKKVYRYYNNFISETAYSQVENLEKRVLQVRQYVDENLFNNDFCSIRQLAESFFLSERSLRRIFKQQTGFTIHNYIESRRIAKAIVLLDQNEYNIKDICNMCGYSDSSYFSKVFKKNAGYSFKELKKQKTQLS